MDTKVKPVEFSFNVEGMTCASCSARVERALRKVPGVTDASVNLATEKASVTVIGEVGAELLMAAIRKAGYEASTVRAPSARPSRRSARSNRCAWRRRSCGAAAASS